MKMTFTGPSLATDFSLPNVFFDVTTAYGMLRMNGVKVGKMDVLAGGHTGSGSPGRRKR